MHKTLHLLLFDFFSFLSKLSLSSLNEAQRKSLADVAFMYCRSLRIMILPHAIDLSKVCSRIIVGADIKKIAENVGVALLLLGGIRLLG